MPRPRNLFPTPRCHKGAAVVDVYDGGTRRTVTLGPWNSEQARQEFERLLARLRQAAATPAPVDRSDLTVNEVLLAYCRWRKEPAYARRQAGS
jgi:hypothetical protein